MMYTLDNEGFIAAWGNHADGSGWVRVESGLGHIRTYSR